MTRILIADDHSAVRAGYRQFLEAEAAITTIGEAATGREALEQLLMSDWDVLLLDIHMPDCGGIEILRQVVSKHPKVRVLIMSGLAEAQYARLVIREGASGYVSKAATPEEFLKSVRTILLGRHYVSDTLADAMARDLESRHDPIQPQHARLSSRELQVFLKIASGEGVSAIAKELTLSVKTVSTYRSRILEKMGLESNADITGYALRNNMVGSRSESIEIAV
jgi:two-component system, NarL family, invasion response regulator UvrY